MTNRATKLATLLMIGAAMAATPTLAQTGVVAGNTGPAEIPVNRDAPFSLPGDISATPLPTVGDATSRDLFGTNPDAALAGLGTATLERDGSTTERPASAALRALFEALIKGNTGN